MTADSPRTAVPDDIRSRGEIVENKKESDSL